jgi:hypothetical protein
MMDIGYSRATDRMIEGTAYLYSADNSDPPDNLVPWHGSVNPDSASRTLRIRPEYWRD